MLSSCWQIGIRAGDEHLLRVTRRGRGVAFPRPVTWRRTRAQQLFPWRRRGNTMLGSFRSNVTVCIAVLVGIAGLSYVLAASAAPPGGTTAAVEFTPDGRMKRPEGYREWIYIGTPLTPNDMNGGDAPFPEFHAVGARGSTIRSHEMKILGFPIAPATARHVAAKRASAALG